MRAVRHATAGLVLGALGTLGLVGFVARTARADEIDDDARQLFDLEQRVRELNGTLKDTPPPPPDIADRRVLDAQALFGLKQYESAATILLDVVEKYPNSRAYDDAVYLLGEALYQDRDFLSARKYFILAVQKNTGSRNEQASLQRLVEIALHSGDFENIDTYLDRLGKIPPSQLEPSVPYVRAKYLYFRGNLDLAAQAFEQVPATSLYYFQSRYFLATIAVRKGDLAGAAVGYDAILKLQPPDAAAMDVQDLARMALGRIYYERDQFSRAIEVYQSVPRTSKYFEDSLYEQAWTHIKQKDWIRAFYALELLLDANPDSKDAPELKLLAGNLNLRMEKFSNANQSFYETREEFEPVQRQLQTVMAKAQSDPAYYENLLGKNLERFDVAAFIPSSAVKWVRTEPDVEKMLVLATDVGAMQRDIQESEVLVGKLQRAIEGRGRASIFPDLAADKVKSAEVAAQLLAIRQREGERLRKMIDPKLSPEERQQLDGMAGERDGLERQLGNLPTTEAALEARDKSTLGAYADLDRQASEFNVQIQALEAQLVAIEQYYRSSRAEQKIRPEDVEGPVKDLRAAVAELQRAEDELRDEIADARRESSVAGSAGEMERQQEDRLAALLKQEQRALAGMRNRLSADDQVKFDRITATLGRADAVKGELRTFDGRVDSQADVRLGKVKEYLATEKQELNDVSQKLGGVVGESHSLGGGLAQAMLSKVADRFYDLVVRSDVGIIDVAWGVKDQKTSVVTKLSNQKNLELKALDEDFKKLLEEEK